MKEAATAKRPSEPVFGEAAIKEAVAGFGDKSAADAAAANGGQHTPTGAAAPAPKTVSQVLGEITWLMTQSPRHKAMSLGDLEWFVMPAILLKQFRIFYKGEQPVGVALWALADDLAAKRIDAGNTRLSAAEWKSGTNVRIVDVVAPFGGEAEMRGQIGPANALPSQNED
ncbi:toxin-activating lysine-acyltransferase [Bradyrhizobium ivorense]|uniref:toxin-activating lysine-acyltransferase n=1 Tax=Bradyrhizobium ivorense TaxID=2511166 RepID=UPI0011170AD7|nr:toxin-activating lysine-acyltransferase [Bradyrhizobium ivorense]